MLSHLTCLTFACIFSSSVARNAYSRTFLILFSFVRDSPLSTCVRSRRASRVARAPGSGTARSPQTSNEEREYLDQMRVCARPCARPRCEVGVFFRVVWAVRGWAARGAKSKRWTLYVSFSSAPADRVREVRAARGLSSHSDLTSLLSLV